MKTKSNNADTPAIQTVASIYASRSEGAKKCDPWIHPMCRRLGMDKKGPFAALPDGRLLTMDAKGLSTSYDDGKTWAEFIPAAHGQDPVEPASYYLMDTTAGTLVMVYLDLTSKGRCFNWDAQTGEPKNDCCLELYSIRSLDGGKTWFDRQRLLDGYNANFFGFIRTRSGRLVVVAEHLLSNPGRWVVCSFVSDNDGQSWRRSNLIDLGGHGHHDGATEPTVAELSDGRLMMYIRTNLGFFWEAFSTDGGRYWRTIQQSRVDASSSPGHLVRLRSGRLILVWNRRDPEDIVWPLIRPDEQYSEFPASWHREELSIAITENDGKTWSRPIVIARLKGGQLSYPYVFERRDGELWVIAGFASRKWFNEDPIPLGLRIREDGLLGEIARNEQNVGGSHLR